ncbi:MAG: TonB-dependent receptor [Microscillaceae bacterium]|nr:TonB-dependent receptor [Microscillaceae bacterium]MDW8461568.1 TonB-dependent receptor [Cytophagales bacterium]
MKIIYFLLGINLSALLTFSLFAQTLKVLDKTNLQPIQEVSISQERITNLQGEADISTLNGNTEIVIQHPNYRILLTSWEALQAQNFVVYLTPSAYAIDEVVISANKFEEKQTDVPQQIIVLKQKDIAFLSQQNTADLLQQTGQVFVQKSQQGGGSPVLRGFEASRVLIVIDGVRMNNAIYRAGHLQNVIRIDNNMLERAEVIFGPSSVMYGSDALGGVMHFRSRNPELSLTNKAQLKTGAIYRYSSANQESTGNLNLNIGLKKWAFLSNFTYSNFGDLRQGAVRNPAYGDWGKRFVYASRQNDQDVVVPNPDVNLQIGSAYKQYDFLQKILFQQSDNVSHMLNLQYSNTNNVPRYDRLSEINSSTGKPNFAEWYYGPEKRLMGAYTLQLKNALLYDNARVIVSYQDIEESRITRRFESVNRDSRIERVKLWAFNADLSKVIANHELRYGAEYTDNQVTSRATRTNIRTGEVKPWDTRYPDGGSTYRTAAIYLTHSWEISPQLILSEGLRFNYVELAAKFKEKTNFPFPYDEALQINQALNGNIGLVFMPDKAKTWRFASVFATGFRSPNVDDLGRVFESVTGNSNTIGTLVVPNPNIKPELTYNIDLNASKIIAQKVKIEATGFYTWYEQGLALRPYTFNGQSQVIYNGFLSNVVANTNQQRAYIYGFSAGIYADITPELSFTSILNYTKGRIRTDSTAYPLDHIPPTFGRTSIVLNLKKFRGEFFAMYNGWKRIEEYNLFGEDNQRYATPWGTPAWITLNLRTAYQINPNLQLQVNIENLLDTNYRHFASGISAAGRNFMLTLRANY